MSTEEPSPGSADQGHRPAPEDWSLRSSDACLASAVIIAPLAVGTVHPGSWALLLVLALGGWLFALRGGATAQVSHPLIIALIALSGLTVLLPLIPLPPGLQELLSPHAAEQWARGLPGSEPTARWGPLHRAPGPGAYSVLRWCAGVSFLLACMTRAAEDRWRQRATVWILCSGAVAATVCLVQTTLEMEAILGIYQPRMGMLEPLRAPFLNENHWAGFLGVVLVLGVAELLRGHHSARNATLLVLLSVTTGVMVLITNSHSGALGSAAGLTALVVLNLRRTTFWKAKPALRRLACVLVALPLAAVAAMAVREETAKSDPVTGLGLPFLSDEPRLSWLPETWQLIKAHSWTGVGVGGFLDAFPTFRLTPGRNLAYQPEVLPIKLLSEGGLLVGGLLLVVLLALVGAALWTASRHPRRIGAAAALFALLVHEQADFASHTGGVLLPALVLLTVALPPSASQRRMRPHLLAAGALAGLALLTIPTLRHWDLQSDLDRWGLSADSSTDELAQVGKELWTWHPSSFVLAQELGARLAEAGAPNRAMAWLNRAMLLAPHHPDPHLMTARLLRALGARQQALVEYRMTVEADWRYSAMPVFNEVMSSYSELDELLRVVPRDNPDALGLLALLAIRKRDARAEPLAEMAYQNNPEHPRAAAVKARTLLNAGRRDEAREIAIAALSTLQMSPATRYQLLGTLWNAGGRVIATEQLAALLTGEPLLAPSAFLRLAEWRYTLKQPKLARVALRQARRGTPHTVARSLLLEARLDLENGEHLSALGLVRRAQDVAPELTEPWVEEVRILVQTDQAQQATETARRHARKLSSSPAGRALLKALSITAENTADGEVEPSVGSGVRE